MPQIDVFSLPFFPLTPNLPPMDEFEIMGGGLEVEYNLNCDVQVGRLDYVNKLFVEYSKLQTNKMLFLKDGKLQTFIKDGREQQEKVLTTKITTGFFDFQDTSNNNIKIVDTDEDGLADNEEKLYGTNLNISDSDFDGYSDKVEVDSGWDPISWNLSPGQKVKVSAKQAEEKHNQYHGIKKLVSSPTTTQQSNSLPEDIKKKDSEKLKDEVKSKEEANYLVQGSTEKQQEKKIIVTSEKKSTGHKINSTKFFKTGRLQKFLEKIKYLFEKDGLLSKLLIFVLIYFLGVLHAFESGHGKSILVSYLIDHNRNKKDALIFSTVMTVTHLVDIIILSIAFKLLSLAGDIYNYINHLQKVGACILLLLGIYYLIRSFIPKRECDESPGMKKAAWLGFIAGLAPCTVGWAIMVILLSIGKIGWLVPVIMVFGFGIWTTLLVFSFLIIKTKNKLISKVKSLTKITPIISALLLIIVAIILLI